VTVAGLAAAIAATTVAATAAAPAVRAGRVDPASVLKLE